MNAPAMRQTKWRCKACNKTAYQSEGRAYAAIEAIKTINDSGHIPVRAYPCDYGNGWHLTSKEERKSA